MSGRRPVLLAVAAALGFVLAGVQVTVSYELTRRSERAATTVARSLYELPGRMAGGPGRWLDGVLCRHIPPGSHHQHVYHFSVGPWRVAEYFWPGFSGRQFPVHRRWVDALPAEGRVWTPSLYMGIVPLVLALSAMRWRRTDARTSWLSWIVALSLVASFGWYGPGWLIGEVCQAVGGRPDRLPIGPPVGGLYWLLTVLLPGYVTFRYPAKLLVITALALSMLASAGWDRAWAERPAGLRRLMAVTAWSSLAGALAALASRPFWPRWFARVEPNVLFGPLDVLGANDDLVSGFLQAWLVLLLFGGLLGRPPRLAGASAAAGLALVVVDLVWANGWMVVCVPRSTWDGVPAVAAALEGQARPVSEPHHAPATAGQKYRVGRHPLWLPARWSRSWSRERISQAVRWDRHSLWPKHNLERCVALMEVSGTMMPYDCQAFLRAARDRETATPRLLARYVILPADKPLARGRPVSLPTAVEAVRLWYNPEHLPRAWIVHEVEVVRPLDRLTPQAVARRTAQALVRDLRQSALVETARPLDPKPVRRPPDRPGGRDREMCRITHYGPLRVEIEAVLRRPGLVVLCDQYYPGWRLEVETAGQGKRPADILRTNRVMRGVWLDAGRHRLVYRYRPASFFLGATLSAAGWAGLALASMALGIRAMRRPVNRAP